ncbi:MAG: hypothetical protein M1820_006365 [Bogoriella megaspora]|nr:MAG: hypothetical protein M1820_006365 [Bogoriella megaspora]
MDILGSSVPAVLEDRFDSERLPREIATTAIRELLCGISYLHRQGLAHGDIHVGNLCFSAPSLASTTEEELLRVLGRPTISKVHGRLGQSHNQGIPEYLVRPSPVPVTDTPTKNIRIIDFGQSFTNSTRPRTLKTPLVLRPPEVLFNDDWDYRVDLWSTGCTIFELMTGQPPFDSVMATKETLIVQMIESIGQLPPMWQDKLPPNLPENPQNDGSSIQEWLRELIFDSDLPPNYTGEEVEDVGSLIGQLMRFNPYERISAEEACRKWSTYFPP